VGTASRFWNDDGTWQVALDGTVAEPGPLRVVGSGSGWRVELPVPDHSTITNVGPIVVDGSTVTLPPADYGATRRLTFDATAGERVALIMDGSPALRLRLPDGTSVGESGVWSYLTDLQALPTSGLYTLDLGGSSDPVTVRLARPQVVDVDADGSTVTLPAVSDPRVPREVVVDAAPGDVLVGDTWHGSDYCGVIVRDITSSGGARFRLYCDDPTSGEMNVRVWRAKVYPAALGTPTSVTADAVRQPLAFRFTTPVDGTYLDLALPWSLSDVGLAWLGTHYGVWNVNTDDVWFDDAGPHVLVVRPHSTYPTPLAGDVTLSISPD
jgi:hypothetical protein